MIARKTTVPLLLGLALAFGAGVILKAALRTQQSSDTGLVPFTATTLTILSNPDGSEAMREIVEVARKSDGSRATSTQRQAHVLGREEVAEFRQVEVVKSGMNFDIYPIAESISSFRLPPHRVRQLTTKVDCSAPGGSWVIEDQPSTILGYKVIRRSLTTKVGEKESIHDEWVASDLDCYALRKLDRIPDPTGGGKDRIFRRSEVLRIVPGEPDELRFQIPPFAERSPREVHQEIARRRGVPFETNHAIEARTERYDKAK